MDKDTSRRLEKGREHYENREYDKAEPYLLKVVEVEDRFADVLNMLGVIYHDKGQVTLAQEYFERALKINPRYTEAALNLAVAYNEQGSYEKSKNLYEKITGQQIEKPKEIEPFARGKLANMHAEMGRAYAELERWDKAIAQYREALNLCPDFVDIRTRLGQTLKEMGRFHEAQVEFETAKRMRSTYLPARVSLGVTYFAMGDKRSACREWQEIMTIDPENKTADMYLKMVEQLIAQQEAEDEGVHLEVESNSGSQPPNGDELTFSFEGERASVASIPPATADPEDDQ